LLLLTPQEKLCVYGLLETGLRVSELAGLPKDQIQWQQGAIHIKGKGGPYGKKSKVRVIPMSRRLKPLLENVLYLMINFRGPLGRYSV
jgi:integrase/recombinase XerD